MKRSVSYILFILIMYLFVFQFALMQVSAVFSYWDELYALLALPLFVIKKGKVHKRRSETSRIMALLITYIAVGLLSNCLFRFQGIAAICTDLLLQLKFFLGIVTTYYLFRKGGIFRYKKQIKLHAKVLIGSLLLLVVINKITKFFPNGDSRFGISSEMLFFGHPTGLASVSFFLILIVMLFYKDTKSDRMSILCGVIIVLSTLRLKAIAAALAFCYIYFIVVIRRKKLTGWKLLPCIPAAVLVGWDEFFGYFLSSNTMNHARGALFHTGITILKDYFPLGTGLGTFASDPSGAYYSPVYEKYGIQNVWGLGKDWPILVSDTFWPMVMGQTGFIGLVLYVCIIIELFKLIKPAYKVSKGVYIAAVGALVYLLVSSIAESAFVNPLSLPLAFVLGTVMCWIERDKKGFIVS